MRRRNISDDRLHLYQCQVRNSLCPMCGDPPELERVEVAGSRGDGFTLDTDTDTCSHV